MVEGCDITDKSALSALVDAVEVGAEVQILQLHTKTWQPGEIRLCELMYGTISRCWITGLFLSVVEYSRAQHSIGMRGHDHRLRAACTRSGRRLTGPRCGVRRLEWSTLL
jgi:hypothetical protein